MGSVRVNLKLYPKFCASYVITFLSKDYVLFMWKGL